MEQAQYATPETKKEVIDDDLHEAVYDTPASQQAPHVKETRDIMERKESPVIPPEKIEAIISGMTEMTLAVKDLKNVLSAIHAEIKDLKKEQREISRHLRSITDTVEHLQTKRGWFRFS